MKDYECPLGGECSGTGWEWVLANDGPNPESGHYEPCGCNPYRLGEPEMPMVRLRSCHPAEPRIDFELETAPF